MFDIDFRQIVPRGGGQREAFEEMCCQLAHRTVPSDASYVRLYGAGGDGGVECFADLSDRSRIGWQAKYVFEIGPLLTQTTKSFTTALKIHSTLKQYVLCFPFDLTGPTGRQGQSTQEKLNKWRIDQEKEQAAKGRSITIELWSASKLRALLLQYDVSGGIREYFFNQKILTNEWFSQHLQFAQKTAGPRYTPELNVKTDLWEWFSSFGRTAQWSGQLKDRISQCKKACSHFSSAVSTPHSANSMSPAWPENLLDEGKSLVDALAILDECARLASIDNPDTYRDCINKLDSLLRRLASLESKLVEALEAEHGKGKADSPGFRQFMAEYMVSFPAANIDCTRDAIAALSDLFNWIKSPKCSLAYERIFILSGAAGSGKTHGVCDAADHRFNEGLLTCVTFGHEFRGEPDPWTRLSETLGLPLTMQMNGLLDALNAAGEASGSPLILCIDAVNETRPLRYWRDRLPAFFEAIQQRHYLRLCITCRTSYLKFCLIDSLVNSVIEHKGFAGVEREACQAFFGYYNIEPPIAPILQPELSNPLYLSLVCKTLCSCGLRRLPLGWLGISTAINEFLDEKERQFAVEFETSPNASIVRGSLSAISAEIAEIGDSLLSRSRAQQIISIARPAANNLPVLDWLISADLLIEDAPVPLVSFSEEGTVRPAFERLGDFLVALELIKLSRQAGLKVACQPEGALHKLLKDPDVVEQNNGLLSALSILIPEQNSGVELPNLVDENSIRIPLVKIAIQSFPSRDPGTYTGASQLLVRETLGWSDFSFEAMDALLAQCWQPSKIDALWLDALLVQRPLAKRDAYWCRYLHDSYESNGIVRRLIDAAFELPLLQLDHDIAERWSTALLWFTAAADRRVKDWTTRALTAILTAQPKVLPNLLQRFLFCDDDKVRERTFLSCYGALILSRDIDTLQLVADFLQKTYSQNPEEFNNALLRDYIRCISELAQTLNILPEGCAPELTMRPISSEWPLKLPLEDEVKAWGKLLRFEPGEFMSDFFKYSMGCLRPWEHGLPKKSMGEWILQRAVRDFGYEGSGCDGYDNYMLREYGGGRSKPNWAEKIGKKYQWIGLYQLASRLSDHIERKENDWDSKPLQTPLILQCERKLDPTMPPKIAERERYFSNWWVAASADLDSTGTLSDEEWVLRENDIPSLENLLSVVRHNGQTWRLLVSHASWGHRDEDEERDTPYRNVWMHIGSYLVRKENFIKAYNNLLRRNFFGRWMPGEATWISGFAGEYPWATPFNTEPEEWHSYGRSDKLSAIYQPSWNQLAMEWEYDATLSRQFHMIVPARAFFSIRDLWWNGKNGYRYVDGKTIFQDPSVVEAGPASLMADADDIQERLEKLGLCLIWTVLGEKWILGGRLDASAPRRTFSQVACSNKDGSLRIGERLFFDDYNKDTCPS